MEKPFQSFKITNNTKSYQIVCLRFEDKNCELVQKLAKILLSLSDRVIRITRTITFIYKKTYNHDFNFNCLILEQGRKNVKQNYPFVD